MKINPDKARKLSFNNKVALQRNEKCACFYCYRVFSTKKIKRWGDGGKTGICPYCWIDALIAETHLPIMFSNVKELQQALQAMHEISFGDD